MLNIDPTATVPIIEKAVHEIRLDGLNRFTGVLVEINDAHLAFTNPIPVHHFNHSAPIGRAYLKKTKAGLVATIETEGVLINLGFCPAIAIKVLERRAFLTDKQDHIEGVIFQLLLNNNANIDERIRPLREQVGHIKLPDYGLELPYFYNPRSLSGMPH